MAESLSNWRSHLQAMRLMGPTDDWSDRLIALTHQRLQDLPEPSLDCPPLVLLAEADPVAFLAGFLAACVAGCSVALGNPQWGGAEWAQVFQQLGPDRLWGEVPALEGISIAKQSPEPDSTLSGRSLILIPTGGSSGGIRFVMHTWETLAASVQGFQTYFGRSALHACCVLPLYHVSGLMQFLRAYHSGGVVTVMPFHALASGHLPAHNPAQSFLSLVPTQLARLLPSPTLVDWLAQYATILLGGAPAWDDLVTQARQHHLRLAPTYGMTETASQIATLKPEAFLQGQTGCGQVLPHAQIQIWNEAGDAVAAGEVGRLIIRAESLALGYYPHGFATPGQFEPDDLGYLDDHGYLHLLGRSSDKIITGGENVFPAEVEAAIYATGLVRDVAIVGVGDRHWGEAVTAVYVPLSATLTVATLQQALEAKLSRYKLPKHWVAVSQLPRNAQGKLNRTQLRHLVSPLDQFRRD